jgi:hypothetical protein
MPRLLTIVKDRKEIRKYHEDFKKMMLNYCEPKEKKLEITTRGGSWETKVYYVIENNFWWTYHRDSSKKFFNLIGINPNFTSTNHILVQLNYQQEFKDFREAAFWAKDNVGKIFLLHSGKMGGGVKGITQANIDKLYSGSRSTLLINNLEYEYYTICELYSPRAFYQVIAFIDQITKIKSIIKSGEIINSKGKKPIAYSLKFYTPEFWGKRTSYTKNEKTETDSDHGLIVDTLRKVLENNFGLKEKVFNNKYIDLGIVKKNKAFAIFEIKTNNNLQSLYTGIGQLTLHSYNFNSKPLKYLVLPKGLKTEIIDDLEALQLKLIFYEWINNKAVFTKLLDFFP